MPRLGRAVAPKGKAPEMDWDATDDADVVAEYGWQDEEETLWTCTMCKRYVKMKHLMKLWPRAQARISGPRREGLASSCESSHFLHRYHEVTAAVGVRNSRPEIMLYSNMAMVWAEIVLHKDVDWRTVAGRNVSLLDRSQHFIPTTWNDLSDCWPRWSNRRCGDNPETHQQRRTHPREDEGHNYNDYNHGNDMGGAPISFGGGSGGHNYGGGQCGTITNTPHNYTPTHPRDTYEYHRNSPGKEEEHQTSNYAHGSYEGYGQSSCGSHNTPPPTFGPREDEDAEFQRQMREATLRSQEDYIRRLEDETRFMHRQYNNLYDLYSSGPYSSGAGPSRRRDSDSDED
jgi:hypothetical protein